MLILLLVLILTQFASSVVGFYWLEKKLKGDELLAPLKKIIFPGKEEVMEWTPPEDEETKMSIKLTEDIIHGEHNIKRKKKT